MSQNPQTPDGPLTNIFINYRRDDTRSDAGRLESDLERYFPGRVFRDVHDIEAGTDFMEVINKEVGECGALLVMIGQKWLTVTDKAGKRRLDNPDDPVAVEIAGALKRKDVRVIPVLVQDMKMPEEGDLPEQLKGLAHRTATNLDDEYWSADVSKLVAVLEKVCGASPQQPAPAAKVGLLGAVEAPPGRSGVMKMAIVAGAAALVAALAVGVSLSRRGSPRQAQEGNAGLGAQPQAALVPHADAPKTPPDAPKTPPEELRSASRSALVNLARNEAEFFFPFDTRGDKWTWYRKESKAESQEYHWDVFVPGDYKITLFVKKAKDAAPGRGDFTALLGYTQQGVRWAKPDEEFGEVDPTFPLDIEPRPEPDGLRLVVKGAGVARMFAKERPKEVWLMSLRPDEGAEVELTTPVEYK